MVMTRNDKDRLDALRIEADEAFKEARAARLKVTQAYAECAAQRGTGPTDEQIVVADQLEARADELWSRLSAGLGHLTF